MAFRTRTATLSSVGTSGALFLDPTAKATTVMVSATAVSSLPDVTLQVTLDDPASLPAPTVVWAGLSTTHYTGANILSDGLFLTVLSPIGGLRLSASTLSSGTLTLKVLQSVTA